jgi:hypothetical protein
VHHAEREMTAAGLPAAWAHEVLRRLHAHLRDPYPGVTDTQMPLYPAPTA